MKCPVDNETLVIAERSGVEIDYCPKCRGVWLDRGELDKIIDRAATVIPAPAAPQPEAHRPEHYRDEDHFRGRDEDDWKRGKGKRHKRESFLSDLFDF
ncbi:MAG: zf-TFIIB domain-containing protein [Hyphomonas sp.]